MFAFTKREVKFLEGPRAPWFLIVLVLLLLAGAVSFFGQRQPITATSPTPSVSSDFESRTPLVYTVSYKSGVFSPTNLRIHAGDTVRFKNEGFFGIHIVSDGSPEHRDLPGFDSIGDVPQNSYFSFTFSEKGIFGYHNEKKPNEGGTIIVR